MNNQTKQLALIAMLIALSVIGAQIKVFNTIAFDSVPAFIGGLLINPVAGGIIGIFGHLVTAGVSSFPLGLLTHLIISLMMFLTVYLFAKVYQKSVILAVVVAVIFNGPLSLLLLTPIIGVPLAKVLIVPLSIVAAINSTLGIVVFKSIFKGQSNDL